MISEWVARRLAELTASPLDESFLTIAGQVDCTCDASGSRKSFVVTQGGETAAVVVGAVAGAVGGVAGGAAGGAREERTILTEKICVPGAKHIVVFFDQACNPSSKELTFYKTRDENAADEASCFKKVPALSQADLKQGFPGMHQAGTNHWEPLWYVDRHAGADGRGGGEGGERWGRDGGRR